MEVISFLLSCQLPDYERQQLEVNNGRSQQWADSTVGGVKNNGHILTFSQSILQSWVFHIFFPMEDGEEEKGEERRGWRWKEEEAVDRAGIS